MAERKFIAGDRCAGIVFRHGFSSAYLCVLGVKNFVGRIVEIPAMTFNLAPGPSPYQEISGPS